MLGVDVLARPLLELLETFGTGVMPPDGPADALRVASVALDAAYAVASRGLAELGGVWSGAAAEAAAAKAEQTQVQQVQLSDRGQEIATVLTAASQDVNTGVAELEAVVQSFVSVTTAAGPALATPAGQVMIIAAALDHLSRGLAVVARVRAELTAHTGAMTALTTPEPGVDPADPGAVTAAVRPSGAGPTVDTAGLQQRGDAFSGFGRSFANAAAAPGDAYPGFAGGAPMPARSGGRVAGPGRPGATGSGYGGPGFGGSDFSSSGSGSAGSSGGSVEVFLPDGTTAMAPNQQAADAVRNALSQQGVPYVWGGTTPGQGLDCSGLTQWAYGEAGVQLPRLAQEQDIGIAVDQSELMPGDLAVWDGHVAMVIGGGQMVEAGDPVQVSSVRTENIGMGFHGFYRPTT
ncbi:C40 family peptidase [Rhodococcus tukisamuensis]|uniref:NlpC/P60 family protein n=1 Tax=Rhodococcus tukisamuensis TaxID=168276 RepID=A0A1G6Y6D8_9NOCA|nr:C40 family peptidase [Rhodococcus tukisamuensis]SDD86064.1 NlpC/P60 family protein [Rhodococcus tukisamuensis]